MVRNRKAKKIFFRERTNVIAAVFFILFDLTAPAICIAPLYNSSFSVNVVFPASG